jgi:hypothetical protein
MHRRVMIAPEGRMHGGRIVAADRRRHGTSLLRWGQGLKDFA